jgi:hypothetical protein
VRQVTWQQERRVGFDHQPLGRDALHQLAQADAAALVANEAGDADAQTELQVAVELTRITRKALHHTVDQPGRIVRRP